MVRTMMTNVSSPQGTYFEADGSKADFSEALHSWVTIAYELLIQTAQKYNRTLTYKEITEAVQARSGIRTKMLISNWSGKLLEQVAKRAAEAGEPPLTSLCVHQDGTIGDGYAQAPKAVNSDPAADVEDLAAQHRLLCYQKFATDLPSDGGVPTLTPEVAAVRNRRTKNFDRQNAVCPTHFMELSATGVCAECD
ncbi:hypothetical protein CV023_09175 [Brevibacterium sp. CCUG 69071]|nr:hypothetical protein [Brevibacterium sp. CCUG 69071]